jgi:pimeloyl-ACP methyl ester carboxylesterase
MIDNKMPWLVIPGGPGLSNSYLQKGLSTINETFNLKFYDLLGSPESNEKKPTLKQCIEQTLSEINQTSQNSVGLITHSFGSFLALQALKNNSLHNVKAIIMLNPAPFDDNTWRHHLQQLSAQIPEDTFKKMSELTASDDPQAGAIIFKLLYPFYTASKSSTMMDNIDFDINACNHITEQIREYNHQSFLKKTQIPHTIINGDKDPFYFETANKSSITLNNVGHYPFYEAPDLFKETMKQVFNTFLKNQTKPSCSYPNKKKI